MEVSPLIEFIFCIRLKASIVGLSDEISGRFGNAGSHSRRTQLDEIAADEDGYDENPFDSLLHPHVRSLISGTPRQFRGLYPARFEFAHYVDLRDCRGGTLSFFAATPELTAKTLHQTPSDH